MKRIDLSWQFVIWGLKLHTHTHSYVWLAFYRALRHLGARTLWLDSSDSLSGLDLGHTVFITSDMGDTGIPLSEDCFYVMHNCGDPKYAPLLEKRRCLYLQYFNGRTPGQGGERLDEYTYFDGRGLHQPWATDLLPHEIDANKPAVAWNRDSRIINWVGTATIQGRDRDRFSNLTELGGFERACSENGIRFVRQGLSQGQKVSPEDHIRMVKESYMAPALVGGWQQETGYVPCRVFKNISYGQFGITNCPQVQQLFGGRLAFSPDSYRLFYEARERLESATLAELHAQMDEVRDKHTYINRIQRILECVNRVI